MFVKINGEKHYLWQAVDHEGEVLEAFATKTRNKPAALKFLTRTMKRPGNQRWFGSSVQSRAIAEWSGCRFHAAARSGWLR